MPPPQERKRREQERLAAKKAAEEAAKKAKAEETAGEVCGFQFHSGNVWWVGDVGKKATGGGGAAEVCASGDFEEFTSFECCLVATWRARQAAKKAKGAQGEGAKADRGQGWRGGPRL